MSPFVPEKAHILSSFALRYWGGLTILSEIVGKGLIFNRHHTVDRMKDIISLAKERADLYRIKNVIVATNSGATVKAVRDLFGLSYLIIAVGNPSNANERGLVYHQGVSEATRVELEQMGIKVVLQDQSIFQAVAIGGKPYRIGDCDISGHCFNIDWSSSLDSVVKHAGLTGPFNPIAIVSNTLVLFGDGPRVCIEAALMAADSGILPLDADCIVIQRRIDGASNMPDAAMVLRPTRTQNIFKGQLRIKDLVLVPGLKDHWFDNGPLWVG